MNDASRWLSSHSTQNNSAEILVTDDLPLAPSRNSIVTSILSGKGGVGKTSTSLKLAATMSAQGFKVLLIDCDYNLSNSLIKLGMAPNDNFYQLICYQRDFESCLVRTHGFDLLPTCNGNESLFDYQYKMDEILIEIVNSHRASYDFIFLDCPAGLTKESMNLAAYSEERIFVVNPDKSSITDSYSLMKILSQNYSVKENSLIVNKFSHHEQYLKVVKTMSETAENFLKNRTKILGGIPKIEFGKNSFDNFFMQEKDSYHKSFLKISNRLAENVGDYLTGSLESNLLNSPNSENLHQTFST